MELIEVSTALGASVSVHWSQLLSPVAILVSAGVAVFVAKGNWDENRKLARERAAVELILRYHKEQEANFRALHWLIKNGVDFEQLALEIPSGTASQSWDEAQLDSNLPVAQRQWMLVKSCLNYFEALAIAINKGAIDADTVKEFSGPHLVWCVEKVFPFIIKVRQITGVGEDSTWKPIENLAVQWGAKLTSSD